MSSLALNPEQVLPGQALQFRRLAQVLGLTREMLMLAEKGEWEQVADMELERRQDLADCFAESIPASETELIAEALAVLLHLNDDLMAKLRIARSEVMVMGREFTRNRQAVDNYQAVDAQL